MLLGSKPHVQWLGPVVHYINDLYQNIPHDYLALLTMSVSSLNGFQLLQS